MGSFLWVLFYGLMVCVEKGDRCNSEGRLRQPIAHSGNDSQIDIQMTPLRIDKHLVS